MIPMAGAMPPTWGCTSTIRSTWSRCGWPTWAAVPILTADWNARRTAVLVRLADGRTLIVQTSGNVLDVTGTVGAGFVGWGE